MFKSKRVKDAEFQRNGTVSWIAVFLPDVEDHISLSSSLISYCAKVLSERELEETIELLSRKAKVMLKQRNFPPIYDEMLSELKDILEERYK